jgi:hypothetical protein
MRKRFSPEQISKAIELYNGGMTHKEVGAHLGFSDTAVGACLRAQGVKMRSGKLEPGGTIGDLQFAREYNPLMGRMARLSLMGARV